MFFGFCDSLPTFICLEGNQIQEEEILSENKYLLNIKKFKIFNPLKTRGISKAFGGNASAVPGVQASYIC